MTNIYTTPIYKLSELNNIFIELTSKNCNHRCKNCYLEYHSLHIPKKEELLNLITTMSFLQIGKIYGVSDNAVRKWCKKYDLPFKYKDIKLLRQSLG